MPLRAMKFKPLQFIILTKVIKTIDISKFFIYRQQKRGDFLYLVSSF